MQIRLTFRQKLVGLALLGAVTLLVVGTTGYYRLSQMMTTSQEQVANNTAQRAQMHADMMHDGIRADVYSALFAAERRNQEDLTTVVTEFNEHAQDFQQSLAEVEKIAPDPGVREKTQAAMPAIQKYVEQARLVISAAASNRAQAISQLPAFEQSFSALEEKLGALGDLIEKDVREAQEHSAQASQYGQRMIIWTALLAIAGLLFLSYRIGQGLTRPLQQTVRVLQGVAAGDLRQKLEIESHDEIGQMAQALNQSITEMSRTVRAIGHTAQMLASAADELNQVSQQMSASAEETSVQSNVVSSAAEEVSKNVQTVAVSGEEMSASIREIARNASDVAQMTSTAVQVAGSTTQVIAQLGDSSKQIGNVIKVITSIAEQTNMLALNATIEAARAGEAGKGFAVVANEVKELAKETAKATEDISQKVSAIQGDTAGAVTAIEQISTIVSQVSDIQNTIASAVEEQTATTNEISRSVTEAARGSAEIASNIMGMSQAAQTTATGAGNSQRAAQELTQMAAELRHLITRFQYEPESSDSSAQSPGLAASTIWASQEPVLQS